MKRSRIQFLLGAAAATGTTVLHAPAVLGARTAVIRFGIDLAQDHPTTKAAIAAGEEIKTKSNGAVELHVFPNNQLGDDTHMLSGLRAGGIQMMGIGDNILATLVPSAAIDNVGFAFKGAKTAWAPPRRPRTPRNSTRPCRRTWWTGRRTHWASSRRRNSTKCKNTAR